MESWEQNETIKTSKAISKKVIRRILVLNRSQVFFKGDHYLKYFIKNINFIHKFHKFMSFIT